LHAKLSEASADGKNSKKKRNGLCKIIKGGEMPLFEFPKNIAINGHKNVTVRPLRKEDEEKLHEYYVGLPPGELARLAEDVTNPEVVEKFIYDLDYDDMLPLVALDNGHIVADAALQLNEMGWTRHKGQIRATVAPEYRKKGLSMALIQEMISIAMKMGLEQITAELSPQLDEAYFLCEKMGFKEAAVLKNFIKDQNGNYEDLVIMIKDLLN
jgi:L-amino acid N-acyltransferase YncA